MTSLQRKLHKHFVGIYRSVAGLAKSSINQEYDNEGGEITDVNNGSPLTMKGLE